MLGKARLLTTIGGILLLSTSLISCSSTDSQAISTSLSSPLPPPSPTASNVPEQVVPEPTKSTVPASEAPSSAPTDTLKPSDAETDGAASPPPVEAMTSTIEPKPAIEESPPTKSFQTASPALGGIPLGANEKVVYKKYGLPIETYELPEGSQTVQIWEYGGFSIGLNTSDIVVYIEITSPEVSTGIRGLANGMNGRDAAQILGINTDNLTNVLTLEVSGGWLKVDLDPEFYTVLSLKLLSNEL
jgi:hypothetical protein